MYAAALISLALAAGCATNGSPTPDATPVPAPEPAPIAEANEAPDAAPLPTEGSVEEIATLAAGNSAFAIDLYKHLAAQEQGNLFISPFSISTALAMTRGGARGATAEEMDATLHFSLPGARLHQANQALDSALRSDDDPWELAIANRLWGQSGVPFEQDFLDLTRTHYGAELASVDFVGATEPARQEINGWCSEQTMERIPELLQPGAIDGSTTMVLTNAIYFLGTWAKTFDPNLTNDAPFTKADGKQVQVPTMFQEGPVRWAEEEGLALLALPYEGGRLELVIALPASHDGLPALEAALTTEQLTAWDAAMRPAKVKVWLPRFEQRSALVLSKPLIALGMPSAFSGDADLSGIAAGGGLALSAVIHEAWLKVDEVGTEAAAATAVVVTRSARPNVTEFKADHPFLFFIRDAETKSVLFMGRVTEPAGS